MITDDSYQKRINELYPFLLMATPDQLKAASQRIQPNSPEAMALAMAASEQQTAQKNVQPPQGTILDKQLAALQQPQAPAGIPNVGPNQMALQQAAAQNPNMAGIAAAPENMPLPPMSQSAPQWGIPGAATGGLVSFAHGGGVRGFAAGSSVQALAEDIPDAPGYFESGDINDIARALQRQKELESLYANERLADALQGAGSYSEDMPSSFSSSKAGPSAYQMRGRGYIPEAPAPELSMMEKLSQASAKIPTEISEEMRVLSNYAKQHIPISDTELWTQGEKVVTLPERVKGAAATGLGALKHAAQSRAGRAVAGGLRGANVAALALDPRLSAISALSPMGAMSPVAKHDLGNYLMELTRNMAPELQEGKAQGGEVRRFESGGSTILKGLARMAGFTDTPTTAPESDSSDTGAFITDWMSSAYPEADLLHEMAIPTPKAKPNKGATEGVKAKSPNEQHIETVKTSAGGAGTDRISGSATTQMRNAFGLKDVAEPEREYTPEEQITSLKGLRGEGFKMSPELMQKYEEASKEANRDKWLEAAAAGIGGMLSAPTEHWQKALGMGLIDATSAYQHGAKREEDAGLRYLTAQLGQEQAPYEAQQGAYKDWMDMQKAKVAAQAQRDVAGLRGINAYDLERFKERNRLLHPEVHGAGGMDQKDYSQVLANVANIVENKMKTSKIDPNLNPEEYAAERQRVETETRQLLGLPPTGGAQTANPLSSLGKVFLRQ